MFSHSLRGHDRQPVNDERLARWHTHFGPDRWVEDVEGFRLIGLNAMLLGSGHPEEAAQMAWLAGVMEEACRQPVAWFLHRPLFIDSPDEGDTGYWAVKPRPRAALIELMRRHPVALVASGHLHKAHQALYENTRFVWGPASAFLVGPQMQPPMPGVKQLGAVEYDIEGATLKADIIEVPGLSRFWIDDVIGEVYPPHAPES
jgi:hypothetical protein